MHGIHQLEELAKNTLSEHRYKHTLAVAKLAKELALKYGEDTHTIEMSALLHDMTKEIPMNEQRDSLKGLKNSQYYDTLSNNCIHSITGYYYAKDNLGIDNENILNGILYHTTGREGMSLFEKIIYTADKVSYDRQYSGVEELRELAFVDLDKCMIEIIAFTTKSLLKKKKSIALDTINCYNYLLNL